MNFFVNCEQKQDERCFSAHARASDLIPPSSEAGQRVLLPEGQQDLVHSLRPALIRVQTLAQGHSAPARRGKHLRVPRQERRDVGSNPANLRAVHLKPEAAGPAGA